MIHPEFIDVFVEVLDEVLWYEYVHVKFMWWNKGQSGDAYCMDETSEHKLTKTKWNEFQPYEVTI